MFKFLQWPLWLCLAFGAQAQQLLILNGGEFGGQQYANLGRFNTSSRSFQHLDTIFTQSVQDLYIESQRYAYVAAQDSLVKYDLQTGQRLAATAFGAPSTIKLGIYQNSLLVGNWYEPFGHSGPYSRHLLIFDKNTLALQDSIPDLSFGAKDFVILGDTAYISQNRNDFSTNFTDSLGFLAIVHLPSRQVIRRDTLSNTGADLGRLYLLGDTLLIGFNSVSNTISHYHLVNGQRSTASAGVDLQLRNYAGGAFLYQGQWYLPYNGTIGSYDPIQRQAIQDSIVVHGQNIPFVAEFAWTMDTLNGRIFLSKIFFSNQSTNQGIAYNLQGDSLYSFPVGYSPEVLQIWYDQPLTAITALPSLSHLHAFPNPAPQLLNLRWEANSAEQLLVFDALGRLQVQQQLAPEQTQAQLSTQSWASGWYRVVLVDAKGQVLCLSTIQR
jgi:hypothetical protein